MGQDMVEGVLGMRQEELFLPSLSARFDALSYVLKLRDTRRGTSSGLSTIGSEGMKPCPGILPRLRVMAWGISHVHR